MARELIWSESFEPTDSGRPNPAVWNFDLGDGSAHGIPGWGNNEREYYMESPVTVDSGLTIHALREPADSPHETYYGAAEWTSGKIHTFGKVSFQYGYFEFIAKAPSGGGSWPAIWMLGTAIADTPWPECGEIDIFEGTGNQPYAIRGTLHGPGYSGEFGVTAATEYPTLLSDDFITYGLLWLPDRIEWSVNGQTYSRIESHDPRLEGKAWPFNAPHYLITNLAIGGWFAGEVDPALNEAIFEVKSINVYSVDGIGAVTLA
jgi:beta-glucanase (GH16 family)